VKLVFADGSRLAGDEPDDRELLDAKATDLMEARDREVALQG
jgi:hypothetical protein